MSSRLVELGFALLNAGAQHWRNMSSVAVLSGISSTAAVTPGPSNLWPLPPEERERCSTAFELVLSARNPSQRMGLMNTMWISIRERTREIGTLRAIGMQRARGLAMFMTEAFTLAVTATLAGAALGVGLCALLNLAHLQAPLALQIQIQGRTNELFERGWG